MRKTKLRNGAFCRTQKKSSLILFWCSEEFPKHQIKEDFSLFMCNIIKIAQCDKGN